MVCSKCKKQIRLDHRPGVFLAVAVSTAIAATIVWIVAKPPYNHVGAGALGLVSFISLGGVWTEMNDASAWIYSKLKRRGVECDACHYVNAIYPWSM
jgi:hypothetical protein